MVKEEMRGLKEFLAIARAELEVGRHQNIALGIRLENEISARSEYENELVTLRRTRPEPSPSPLPPGIECELQRMRADIASLQSREISLVKVPDCAR